MDIEDRILDFLKECSRKGATLDEICSRIGIPQATAYRALQRLLAVGSIVAALRREAPGRPKYVYIRVEPWIAAKYTADEIERRVEEEELKQDITIDIVRQAVVFTPNVKEKITEAAGRLKDQDPLDLLLRMARWLMERYRQFGHEYLKLLQANRTGEANVVRTRMELIQKFAYKLFNRQLGIPWDSGDVTGRQGPFLLRYRFSSNSGELPGDNSVFKEEDMRRFLEKHVIGRSVLERVRIDEPKKVVITAGTDASQQIVRLLRGAIFPDIMLLEYPTGIITAVAVWTSREGKPVYDASPEPNDWRRYTLDQAMDKGLVVPPSVYRDEPDMWRRSVEAGMNLRQYVKDYDSLFPDPSLREPKPTADVLIRDGRIFPWEHYFGDFVRDTEHGRLVRMCCDKFEEIMSRVSTRGYVAYCGVVKSPRVEVLTPLLLWYMRFGSAEEGSCIWPDLDEALVYSGFKFADQQLASLLFDSVRDEAKKDERWVTFRCIRRFYTLAEEDISTLWIESDGWQIILRKHVDRRLRKGLPTYDNINTYASLCERASVVSFYADHGPGRVGPRYELLLPSNALISPEGPSRVTDELVLKAMSAIYPILVPYKEDVETGLAEAIIPGWLLLLPEPTVLAHRDVKQRGEVYAKELSGYLTIKLIEYIREEMQAVG